MKNHLFSGQAVVMMSYMIFASTISEGDSRTDGFSSYLLFTKRLA